MKFKSTLTKIAEAMIAPSTTSAAPTAATASPTVTSTTSAPVKDDTAKITELQNIVNSLPDTHPKKLIFLNQIKVATLFFTV